MANPLFRLTMVRPPQPPSADELIQRTVLSHPPDISETPFLSEVRQRRDAGDRQGMRDLSLAFLGSGIDRAGIKSGFVQDLASLETPIAELHTWLQANERQATADDFKEQAELVFGSALKSIIESSKYRSDRARVGDSVLALHLAASYESGPQSHLLRAARIFGLLERIVRQPESVKQRGAIRSALRANVLLPGDLYPLPDVFTTEEEAKLKAHESRLEAYNVGKARARELLERLNSLTVAISNLAQVYELDRSFLIATQTGEIVSPTAPLASPVWTRSPSHDPVLSPVVIGTGNPFLSSAARPMLAPETVALLGTLGFDVNSLEVPRAVAAAEQETANLAAVLYLSRVHPRVTAVGNSLIVTSGLTAPSFDVFVDEEPARIPGPCFSEAPESPASSPASVPAGPPEHPVRSVGIADLLIIEQELQRYELGEVAHIENVLLGETRERTHRRTRTTEQSTLVETETTEETQRDLETTERFELQTESEQVIAEDTAIEAGVTVSGSYGRVDFTANSSFAHNTSKEESQRRASTFARDVTERAVSRIQKRVLERQFRRVIETLEETNLHKFENSEGSGQIAGIYRWVDKVYKAQVVNYGSRAMFEFVVPQPAAFLEHALNVQPPETLQLQKPIPPGYCDSATGSFLPLRPNDITESEYLFWVGLYNVVDVTPPPPTYRVVSKAFSDNVQGDGTPVLAKGDDSIVVPSGYLAKKGHLRGDAIRLDDAQFRVYVGRRNASNLNAPVVLDNEDASVPVAIAAINVVAYAFNVEIECVRSQQHFREWQQATFKAIIAAYNVLKANYDDKIRTIEFEERRAVQGRNPAANRDIERTELKRSVISMLTDQHFDLFDALRKNVPEHGYPELDLDETAEEGPYIRFFEQAFEWENMTYLFYPYFWSRKEDWVMHVLLDDADPLFAQFLRAGAARVVVPARPGFEAAICSYIANGWPIPDETDPSFPAEIDGQTLPYLSLVDEVKAQQGYDGTPGEGTVEVSQGTPDVIGTGTDFQEQRDLDREIHIVGVKYRIRAVLSETEITLTSAYQGPDDSGLKYALGVRYIGEPWEVRVPTSLVMLQADTALPDFTRS